ncbi:sensor histidine kinase [Ottowia flava]|uniref:Sensor histidine kinase n=1 Tax=Ottowia flava TaxID=2675430 RepID=A0ABW4KMV8_9BURK
MPGATGHVLQTALLQLTLLGVEAFLLLSAGVWSQWVCLAWLVHAAFSALYAVACVLDWHDAQARVALLAINVGFFVAMALVLAGQAWQLGSAQAWALLLVALPVGVVLLADMPISNRHMPLISPLQPLVGLELFVLWLALQRDRRGSGTSMNREDELYGRLIQDLHDGVGSRLTCIAAALEQGTPQQRGTAAQLQQCLVELKLLIDGARTEGSVVAHLANLRYRAQPLLNVAGIALHWDVEPSEQLESVQGDAATQVLRIAQEALANAIRHSGGRAVKVCCRALSSPAALLLEVYDDGRGLPFPTGSAWVESHWAHGKGLGGMRSRAVRLGGTLQLDSLPGEGTCVRLQVPIGGAMPPPGPSGRWFLPRKRTAGH